MRRYTLTSVIVFLVASMLMMKPAHTDECLTLGTAEDYVRKNDVVSSFSTLLAEAEICHTILVLPEARSGQMLREFTIDGELPRANIYASVASDYAFKIDEPIAEVRGFLVTKNTSINALDDLGEGLIGLLDGIIWQERYAANYPYKIKVKSIEQLISMLQSDRVVGFLVDQAIWQEYADNHKDWNVATVVKLTGYVWLRKEKAEFAEPIANAIRAYAKKHGPVFVVK